MLMWNLQLERVAEMNQVRVTGRKRVNLLPVSQFPKTQVQGELSAELDLHGCVDTRQSQHSLKRM